MSDCILWQGAKNNKGYGKLQKRGENWLAHRYVYTRSKGAIPVGMMVMHTCDNRLCINPDHLIVGTGLDNARDAKAKGRLYQGDDSNTTRRRWRQMSARVRLYLR